jgi:hypothetical protein
MWSWIRALGGILSRFEFPFYQEARRTCDEGIEDLIEKAGRQIADAIAEQRGVAKKTETASRLLEPQIGGPSQDTKAGKCQG